MAEQEGNEDRAVAVYRRLLALYPPHHRRRFGRRMVQAFSDVRRERDGLSLWWFVFRDLGGSLMQTWRDDQSGRLGAWLALAALALIPGALFLASVVLIDFLGLEALAPLRQGMLGPDDSVWRTLADGVIVMGPAAAAVLAAVPWLRGGRLLRADGPSELTASRAGRWTLLLVGAGMLLAAVFFSYFLAENWQCLIGAAESC